MYNNPSCKSTELEIQNKVANNYDCKEQVWCNDAGRQPGTQYEDTAWTKVEVCDVSFFRVFYFMLCMVVLAIVCFFVSYNKNI